MEVCPRCESFETYTLSELIYLHLTAPVGHTFTKLKKHLSQSYELESHALGHLFITLDAKHIETFAKQLKSILSRQELSDAQALILTENTVQLSPHIALQATQSLSSFVGMAAGQCWLNCLKRNA